MNFYEILEVSKSATEDEIKKSFRRLAKKYHPDVSRDPDAGQKFTLVYTAYDILQDPMKRRMYDELQENKATAASYSQRTYTARERYDDWRREAYAQAGTYSHMRYEDFEDTVLSRIQYHSSHAAAFFIFFVLLCVGITAFMVGSHFVLREDFNGAKVLGYLFWLLGGAVAYTGGQALYGLFDNWKR